MRDVCGRGSVWMQQGMSAPDVCPAGSMCHQTSMVLGERCPRGYYCEAGVRTDDVNDEKYVRRNCCNGSGRHGRALRVGPV